ARLGPLRLVDQVPERAAEALLQDARVARLHEGAPALPAHDQLFHHQLAHGLPDGRAAHLELGGQLVLGQELAADGVDAVLDALPEDARDLVVERERLRVVNHQRTLSSMAAGDRSAEDPGRQDALVVAGDGLAAEGLDAAEALVELDDIGKRPGGHVRYAVVAVPVPVIVAVYAVAGDEVRAVVGLDQDSLGAGGVPG